MIFPGPDRIPSNQAPGGVVIHHYSATEPPRLLSVVRLSALADDIDRQADAALDEIGDVNAGICLVAYDGDTGDRMDWW